MSDNTSSRKRPILATIIAILLLIPTPLIILASIGFLKDPLRANKVFDLLPQITAKVLAQKAQYLDTVEFVNSLSENLKTEYSARMNTPNSSMRKIETYKATFNLIIAFATIFICVGLLRLKKWAYKFILIRLLIALFLMTPIMYLSSKYMKEVMVSAVDKSLYELPQVKGDERKLEIIKAVIQNKTQKQNKAPVIISIIWNLALIGYFLHPKVKKTFNQA